MKYIPNGITMSRGLVGLGILAYYLLLGYATWQIRLWVFGLFVAAALSDWADGKLARWLNYESEFGKTADPCADKLLCWAVFAVMWWQRPNAGAHQVLTVLFAVVACYDVGTLTLRVLKALGRVRAMYTTRLAQVRSFVLQLGLGIFLFGEFVALFDVALGIFIAALAFTTLAVALLLTIISGVRYLWLFVLRPLRLRQLGTWA